MRWSKAEVETLTCFNFFKYFITFSFYDKVTTFLSPELLIAANIPS